MWDSRRDIVHISPDSLELLYIREMGTLLLDFPMDLRAFAVSSHGLSHTRTYKVLGEFDSNADLELELLSLPSLRISKSAS